MGLYDLKIHDLAVEATNDRQAACDVTSLRIARGPVYAGEAWPVRIKAVTAPTPPAPRHHEAAPVCLRVCAGRRRAGAPRGAVHAPADRHPDQPVPALPAYGGPQAARAAGCSPNQMERWFSGRTSVLFTGKLVIC